MISEDFLDSSSIPDDIFEKFNKVDIVPLVPSQRTGIESLVPTIQPVNETPERRAIPSSAAITPDDELHGEYLDDLPSHDHQESPLYSRTGTLIIERKLSVSSGEQIVSASLNLQSSVLPVTPEKKLLSIPPPEPISTPLNVKTPTAEEASEDDTPPVMKAFAYSGSKVPARSLLESAEPEVQPQTARVAQHPQRLKEPPRPNIVRREVVNVTESRSSRDRTRQFLTQTVSSRAEPTSDDQSEKMKRRAAVLGSKEFRSNYPAANMSGFPKSLPVRPALPPNGFGQPAPQPFAYHNQQPTPAWTNATPASFPSHYANPPSNGPSFSTMLIELVRDSVSSFPANRKATLKTQAGEGEETFIHFLAGNVSFENLLGHDLDFTNAYLVTGPEELHVASSSILENKFWCSCIWSSLNSHENHDFYLGFVRCPPENVIRSRRRCQLVRNQIIVDLDLIHDTTMLDPTTQSFILKYLLLSCGDLYQHSVHDSQLPSIMNSLNFSVLLVSLRK